MKKRSWIFKFLLPLVLSVLALGLVTIAATTAIAEPRGEIRVVESWRPDVNVLGHNVLQYLYEYALDGNELVA